MDNKLAIRRLTLYKHGVGFVEREGTLTGSEALLVFRHSEVNDALKSLLVIDRQGGQVRGIHYETPGGNNPDANTILLGTDNSLLDLLRSLRGHLVRLVLGDGTASRDYTGQLVGVEVDPARPLSRSLVTLLTDANPALNEVLSLPLVQLRGVYLLEDRAGLDLRFFLDSSRTDEAHRTIRLELDPGRDSHDLLVSYLIPCPTWRVSYRLLAETSQTDSTTPDALQPAEDRAGELLLQGWGLFDNRLEEDLQEVEVRLVAGQPLSFLYDLTTSRIPQRKLVQDEARIASAPVEFEPAFSQSEMMSDTIVNYSFAAEAEESSAPMAGMAARPRKAMAPAAMKAALQQQTPVARGSELGELFQYDVTTPVSVKRGESALVPIISNTLPYRHELLYNGRKMPRHPVAALRFKNQTGLVLERGPITIVEDGEYRGEAMIAFSPAEAEVYLAYAVELGIKVTEAEDSRTDTTGISITGQYLYFNQVTTVTTTYQFENNLTRPRVVTIEQAIRPGFLLADTQAVSESTAEFYRWKVTCAARQQTSFQVHQRTMNQSTSVVFNYTYDQLRQFMERNWLDSNLLERLRAVLQEHNTINQNEQEINELTGAQRPELYQRQEQLRKNLGVLGTAGEEAELRRRVFEQLSATESSLYQIDQRVEQLKTENKQRRQALEAMLAGLK